MVIDRNLYLKELIDRKENGLIKVITGIRRVGKTFMLFQIYYSYLLSEGINRNHIIQISLDDLENESLRDPYRILNFIKSQMIDSDMYYVMIDEVQMLNRFEEVMNSLLHISNADVYVTGSNSKFLSKDIITEFRGRGDEIHVYPLSFSEFMSVYEGNQYDGWNEYLTYGGLPFVATRKTHKQKEIYLKNLFEETYIKDVIARNNIQESEALEILLNILASSIGSLTNTKRITDTFQSEMNLKISGMTVQKYLTYLEDAFIIQAVNRYDVKGRKYIGTPLKYYYEDIGLRNARLNFRQQEENHIMENIIYNELKYRGYSVDVGVVDKQEKQADGKYVRKHLEIDFIATIGSKKYYIQSAFSLPDQEKEEQEKKSLINVDDSYKKIIVVRDYIMLKRDEYGITTMNIFDFLLNENSLEL